MSRGNAVLESLVIGTVAVAIVLSAAVATTRLQTAGEHAEQTARSAADWAARWGDADDAVDVARRLAPDADIRVRKVDDRIRVVVRIQVPVIGPPGSALSVTVVGRAEAVVAPYRSAR